MLRNHRGQTAIEWVPDKDSSEVTHCITLLQNPYSEPAEMGVDCARATEVGHISSCQLFIFMMIGSAGILYASSKRLTPLRQGTPSSEHCPESVPCHLLQLTMSRTFVEVWFLTLRQVQADRATSAVRITKCKYLGLNVV